MEVVKMKFGSQLYCTATPNSDTDYKGIRLSSWDEIVLGKIPKQYLSASTGDQFTKNTKDDIDEEIFSLHQFVKEALEGQTFAIDMLHASEDKLLATSEIWKDLVANRHKFYTKNIHTFVSYAQGQAAKYGVKGSRLSAAKLALDWFAAQDQDKKVIHCDLSTFPHDEHIVWHVAEKLSKDKGQLEPTDLVEVCNRKITLSVKVSYAKDIVQKFYDQYGERAKQAADNKNVDWKAMHHALRAAYQIKGIFQEGSFSYPLPNTEHLIDVKLGKVDYKIVAQELEDLIDEIKALREVSTLPEKPDVVFWNEWLKKQVEMYCVPSAQIESERIKRVYETLERAKNDPKIQAVCKAARECE